MSIQTSTATELLVADANAGVGEQGNREQTALSPAAEDTQPARSPLTTAAIAESSSSSSVAANQDYGASPVTAAVPAVSANGPPTKKKQPKKKKAASVAAAVAATVDAASQVTDDGASIATDVRALPYAKGKEAKEKEARKKAKAAAAAAGSSTGSSSNTEATASDANAPTATGPAIENFKAFDPFLDAQDLAGEVTTEQKKIELRVQQRNNRKSITTISGLPEQFNLKKVLKALKKRLNCNGTIVDPSKMEQAGGNAIGGFVIQLTGDQRDDVIKFLQDEDDGLGVGPETIWRHGF